MSRKPRPLSPSCSGWRVSLRRVCPSLVLGATASPQNDEHRTRFSRKAHCIPTTCNAFPSQNTQMTTEAKTRPRGDTHGRSYHVTRGWKGERVPSDGHQVQQVLGRNLHVKMRRAPTSRSFPAVEPRGRTVCFCVCGVLSPDGRCTDPRSLGTCRHSAPPSRECSPEDRAGGFGGCSLQPPTALGWDRGH